MYQGARYGVLLEFFPIAGAFLLADSIGNIVDEFRSGYILSAAVDLAFLLAPFGSKGLSEPVVEETQTMLDQANVKASINEDSSGSFNLSIPESENQFLPSDVPTRDFAHGTSQEYVDSIMNNGFDQAQARSASRGGRVNRPGSFFTIELTGDGGGHPVRERISLAYELGQRQAEYPAVLIVKLPENVFNQLYTQGAVYTRPIAGEETFTETIFTPESYNTLNQYRDIFEIIPSRNPSN